MEEQRKSQSASDTETPAGIKKAIIEHWNTDREYAFSLYDTLLDLQQKEKKGEGNEGIDKTYCMSLAEKALDPGYENPELLEPGVSETVIACLKEKVDTYRWQDITQAIACAEAIIRIGTRKGDDNQKAFGYMVLGDSLAIGGENLDDAWKMQQKGAALYLENGNILGWAKTTIGRVGICIEQDAVEDTFAQAATALEFFKRYHHLDLFVRLSYNMMRLLNETGRFDDALDIFHAAFTVTETLEKNKEMHLLILYNNAGISYWQKGEFNKACDCLYHAKDMAAQLNKGESVNIILTNIAYIESMRGNYNKALDLAHAIIDNSKNKETVYILRTKRIMGDCYLNLNRDQEAMELVKTILDDLSQPGKKNNIDRAHAFHLLGTIQAKTGLFDEADKSLLRAGEIFLSLQCNSWGRYTELLRGKVLLMKGEFENARDIAEATAAFFARENLGVNLFRARLLKAESLIGLEQYDEALATGTEILASPRAGEIFSIDYNTHIIMGKAEEAKGNIDESKKYYHKAVGIIENLQQHLTITIRPEFLEDKCEGIHALIRLLLKSNSITRAYETLERLKSMTILGYLTNRNRLFWSEQEDDSRELIRTLEQVRNDYNCLYRIYQEKPLPGDDDPVMDTHQAKNKIREYEDTIRSLVEKLYLHKAKKNHYIPVSTPSLASIQENIPVNALLLSYYSNGEELWAFVVQREDIQMYKLPGTITRTGELLEKYYDAVNFALTQGVASPGQSHLARVARRLGVRLYNDLMKPLESHFHESKNLIIVPFGLLHYIPFSCLYNGTRYLVEDYDLSVLPSAGMISRPSGAKKPGMVILAHTRGGELVNTMTEADELGKLMDSEVFYGKDATRDAIGSADRQILHIAAHGRHRIDQPGLSYIELEDGYLYADDLLQKNLDYELVTLSACETGKTVVKRSEEMIGLIRGVLFGGARSMVVSMWRIDDAVTVELMKHFYNSLKAGESKAASLCSAQRHLLSTREDLHPAFWGAFQLIGHPGPLSHPM